MTERWQRCHGPIGAHYLAGSHRGRILGTRRQARTCNQYGEASRTVPAHIMSTRLSGGRLVTQLCMDGLPRNYSVAILVLEAFGQPRPSPGHMVAYADGDPANCSLANLSWVPRKGDPRFTPRTTRKGRR